MDIREKLAVDRTILANERTLLAYVRTALGFIITGAAIVKFVTHSYAVVFSCGLILLGVLILILGLSRYFKVHKDIQKFGETSDEILPSSSKPHS